MRYLIIILVSLLLYSCGSTKVTNSWAKPNVRSKSYNRIIVLALTGSNRELREQMEKYMVAQLQKKGYNAISSFAEYGPKELDKSDENAAVGRFRKSNADAVLTIVLLDRAREKSYVPSRVNYYPQGMYYNSFWGYYVNVYDRVYMPGYYEINTTYFWESNLYNLNNNNELVYSIQTESFDPESAAALGQEYGRIIVRDMKKKGILK